MPSRRHFGSIRKLPSERYQASYWHKDRHRLAPGTFRTKGDAQAWLSSIEADISRGTWLDPAGAKVTVSEWLEHRLKTVIDGRVASDNTRANYAQIVRVHVDPALGAVKLDKLTAEMVDQFLVSKAEAAWPALTSHAFERFSPTPCATPNGEASSPATRRPWP